MEWVGWASSLVLILTLSKQLHTQWASGKAQKLSKWLYIGQFVAEVGFIFYSWQLRNWVFVVTNVILLLENIIGWVMTMRKNNAAVGIQ